jgi:hypothetical protein
MKSPISVSDELSDIIVTGDSLGPETIKSEYKLVVFGTDLTKYLKIKSMELNEKYFVTRCLDDDFNKIIYLSLDFYFNKYICKYIASASGTICDGKFDLFFGVSDDGIVHGIPFYGTMDEKIIISLIKSQFKMLQCDEELQCDILDEYLELIEIFVKPVKCNVEKPYDITKQYMDYFLETSKHNIKISKYKQDFMIWDREYRFYNCGLDEICSNKSKRFHLYLYCQENGADQEVLDYIASDVVINNEIGVRERKNEIGSFDYWITKFKDENVARIMKMKPKKYRKKNIKHPFINIRSNLHKMNGVWINANYYLIHVRIPFNLHPSQVIKLYNGHDWIASKRQFSVRGDPECIRCPTDI